jgi:hypothetical protein
MAGLYLETKLRPCLVGSPKQEKQKGLFHCWEYYSEVVAPSPMVGGHLGGTVSGVRGVVELEDGKVMCIMPQMIQFVDDKQFDYIWPDA